MYAVAMPNSEYWAQRFAQLENAQHSLGESAKQEISKMYDRAQAEIEAQIDKWYRKLAQNNNISMAEAQKWLKGKQLKEFHWDVGDYIKYAKENAMNKAWVKKLENASAKFHISKLESLNISLEQSLQKLFTDVENVTADTLSNCYKEGYYRTMYEFQKGFKVGFNVARINDPYIAKALYKPWTEDEYNFSENIWKYKTKLINVVHNEITNNLLTGADPQKAIDVIAKKMSNSKLNAGRLVMTEEAYFSSLATGDCFNDLDVGKYEILAILDDKTSEICISLDGKIFDMKYYQAGVTAPPFHCFCRSTTVPALDGDYDIKGSRVARDGDGKTYYIPGDMRFNDWKNAFVNGDKSEYDLTEIDGTAHYSHKSAPAPEPKSKKTYFTKKKLQSNIVDADKKIDEIDDKLFDLVTNTGHGITTVEKAEMVADYCKKYDAVMAFNKQHGNNDFVWENNELKKLSQKDHDEYTHLNSESYKSAVQLIKKGGYKFDDDSGGLTEINNADYEKIKKSVSEIAELSSQQKALKQQKTEWEKKLNDKLQKEQKKLLIKEQTALEKQLSDAQTEIDKLDIKTYSGIWKDPVTTKDYPSLNIQGKKSYFESKLSSDSLTVEKKKEFEQYLKQLEELEKEGKMYSDAKSELDKLKKSLTKVTSDLNSIKKYGIIKADDRYSQERKDKAVWAKNTATADKKLRSVSGNVWRNASKAEKDAIYDYTTSYHKFNEPLRGIEYGTNKFLGVGNVDFDNIGTHYSGYKTGQVREQINKMTDIIDKSEYDFDIWLQRGCQYKGMDNFFGISDHELRYGTAEQLEQLLLDKQVTDYGFFSCGVSKGKGFSGSPIIMNVYCPRNTKMMYAEPFSYYGNGAKRNWDGISEQSSFGHESEMILQQGTTFRITKVERTSGTLYVDIEVVAQNEPQR